MPEFKDRDEYEEWKARRSRELREGKDRSAEDGVKEDPDGKTGRGEKSQGSGTSSEDGGNKELAEPGELFKKAWEIYRRRWGVIISVYILSFLFVAGIFCLCLGLGYLFSIFLHAGREVLPVAGAVTGIIAGSIVFMWGLAAVTYAVADESLGIRAALGRGWSVLWSFMWLISLVGYIIPGGYLLFFVPGVIFSVWFAFSQFIFVVEGEKGMNCLLKSKEYVRGRWLEVFLRLFLVWLASAVLGAVPLLGPILSFFFMPYLLIFIWLVYNDVKSVRGEIIYPAVTTEKLKWIGMATIGYLALPLLALSLLGASILSFPFLLLKRCLFLRGY